MNRSFFFVFLFLIQSFSAWALPITFQRVFNIRIDVDTTVVGIIETPNSPSQPSKITHWKVLKDRDIFTLETALILHARGLNQPPSIIFDAYNSKLYVNTFFVDFADIQKNTPDTFSGGPLAGAAKRGEDGWIKPDHNGVTITSRQVIHGTTSGVPTHFKQNIFVPASKSLMGFSKILKTQNLDPYTLIFLTHSGHLVKVSLDPGNRQYKIDWETQLVSSPQSHFKPNGVTSFFATRDYVLVCGDDFNAASNCAFFKTSDGKEFYSFGRPSKRGFSFFDLPGQDWGVLTLGDELSQDTLVNGRHQHSTLLSVHSHFSLIQLYNSTNPSQPVPNSPAASSMTVPEITIADWLSWHGNPSQTEPNFPTSSISMPVGTSAASTQAQMKTTVALSSAPTAAPVVTAQRPVNTRLSEIYTLGFMKMNGGQSYFAITEHDLANSANSRITHSGVLHSSPNNPVSDIYQAVLFPPDQSRQEPVAFVLSDFNSAQVLQRVTFGAQIGQPIQSKFDANSTSSPRYIEKSGTDDLLALVSTNYNIFYFYQNAATSTSLSHDMYLSNAGTKIMAASVIGLITAFKWVKNHTYVGITDKGNLVAFELDTTNNLSNLIWKQEITGQQKHFSTLKTIFTTEYYILVCGINYSSAEVCAVYSTVNGAELFVIPGALTNSSSGVNFFDLPGDNGEFFSTNIKNSGLLKKDPLPNSVQAVSIWNFPPPPASLLVQQMTAYEHLPFTINRMDLLALFGNPSVSEPTFQNLGSLTSGITPTNKSSPASSTPRPAMQPLPPPPIVQQSATTAASATPSITRTPRVTYRYGYHFRKQTYNRVDRPRDFKPLTDISGETRPFRKLLAEALEHYNYYAGRDKEDSVMPDKIKLKLIDGKTKLSEAVFILNNLDHYGVLKFIRENLQPGELERKFGMTILKSPVGTILGVELGHHSDEIFPLNSFYDAIESRQPKLSCEDKSAVGLNTEPEAKP